MLETCDHGQSIRAAPRPEPQLFHGHGTRSVRVAWLLAEMGLPYRTTLVPFPPRLKQAEFLAINPAGSLPFFIDGPTRMTESVAICLYLVEVYGPTPLAVSPAEASFADYLQFCLYGEATLTQPLGSILRYRHLEPPERRNRQIVDDARALFQRRLKPVEAAVASTRYAAAGRFTVADISIGYALAFAARLGETSSFTPAIQAYADRLQDRPAYRAVLSSDPNRGRVIGEEA
ncbi:glutathione S-transferase family protein [Lichenifustis flavocetrariae]|uniref:Glutathione S-transferase family protein n=1 Tax=Lichenifustis flavocetrariae TaxID=2949735 RepID=A0AA42CN57_9HYPH|nr:glutathione S-transferase family protein [Lichenifustis flavocetrariae]MCW6513188.1 glutathione S-transferase family protein [Lichenifustis flavocetrariae]